MDWYTRNKEDFKSPITRGKMLPYVFRVLDLRSEIQEWALAHPEAVKIIKK